MKKVFIIFSLFTFHFLLLSCGFSPVYLDKNKVGDALHDIYVPPISGTNGIDLRNALRARLDVDNVAGAKYTLKVDLQEPKTIYKAIQTAGDATWQEVRLSAEYTLLDTDGGRVILKATDTASESYTFVRDLVASNASYNNAVQSTIRIMSEKIVTRISAKLVTESKK